MTFFRSTVLQQCYKAHHYSARPTLLKRLFAWRWHHFFKSDKFNLPIIKRHGNEKQLIEYKSLFFWFNGIYVVLADSGCSSLETFCFLRTAHRYERRVLHIEGVKRTMQEVWSSLLQPGAGGCGLHRTGHSEPRATSLESPISQNTHQAFPGSRSKQGLLHFGSSCVRININSECFFVNSSVFN